MKRITLTMVFLLSILRLSAADERTKSNYASVGYRQYYTLNAISAVAERFTFSTPIKIHSLRILTSGDSAAKARVRLLGYEGGMPTPVSEHSIIPAFEIRKTKSGIEQITVELEQPLNYNERQLFIMVDSTVGEMKILMDNTPHKPVCTYGNTKYYHQALREEQEWKTGPFSFCIDLIYTERERSKDYGTYTRDTNYLRLDNTQKEKYQSYNKSLALEDINKDGYTDILYNGLLWINKQNRLELSSQEQKQSRAHVFADIDRDGWVDIIYIGKNGPQDTVYNASYVLNQRGKYGKEYPFRIPSLTIPVTVSVADMNNDGYSDLFIAQTGYTEDTKQLLLLYKPAQREYEEHTDRIPSLNAGGASIYDADKDGTPDIVIADISTGRLRKFTNTGTGTFHEKMEKVIGQNSANKTDYRGLHISMTGDRNIILSPKSGIRTEKEEHDQNQKDRLIPTGSGGTMYDLDGDGKTDYITTASCHCRYAEVYRNDDSHYTNISTDIMEDTVSATGEVLIADMDNDNDPDLIFTGTTYPTVYHYTTQKKRHTALIPERRLNAPVSGSTVSVYSDGEKQSYQIVNGHGLLVQGLGEILVGTKDKEIDSVVVQWVGDGEKEEVYRDIKSGGTTVIREGKGIRRPINKTGFTTLSCYPNPFSEEMTITYELTENADIQVGLYDMQGKQLQTIGESGLQKAGTYNYAWNPNNSGQVLMSGQYQIGLRINGRIVKFNEITYIH